MIPWIESHTLQIGPIALQTWGTLVALGFLMASWIASRRAKSRGLDPKHVWDMAFWIFLSAMIGSRLFHVLFYEPSYYFAHPLEALDPTKPGFAIMGGLIFGALAAFLYVRHKGLDFLAYADTLAWGLPWGCGIGRIGCFLIHDHPGTLSSFVLAVKYPDGQTRHDLGLYLSILGFAIGLFFLIFDRRINWRTSDVGILGVGNHFFAKLRKKVDKKFEKSDVRRPPMAGFWVGMFLILDGVARFSLDFLRIADRRIYYLTPTQWTLFLTTAIGFWLVLRRRR